MKKLLLIILTALLSINTYAQEFTGIPSFRGKELKGTIQEWDTHLRKTCTYGGNVDEYAKYYYTRIYDNFAGVTVEYIPENKQISQLCLVITPEENTLFKSGNINKDFYFLYGNLKSKYGEPTELKETNFKSDIEKHAFHEGKSSHSAFWNLGDYYVGLLVQEVEYFEYRIVSFLAYTPNWELVRKMKDNTNSQIDYSEMTIKELIAYSEQGDAEAQWAVASSYYGGVGVSQDYKEAVYWLRKSAEQGHAGAQCLLGSCYYVGTGVSQDYKEAVYWFRKSVEQGWARAQYNLGVCYDVGNGVSQDYKEAVYWYRKSAEQGHAVAQFTLGRCFYIGEGVSQDYKEAVHWFRKSAEQGFAEAQTYLGFCYVVGEGVSQDYKEAVYWLRKSAEQGDAVAQYNLGRCYALGNGVSQDYKEAVYWYRKSAEQGFAAAQQMLQELEQE